MSAAIAKYTGKLEQGEIDVALRDANPGVRARALHELGKWGEQGAENTGSHEKALYMLDDPSPQVQIAALAALGSMGRWGAMYSDYVAQKLSKQAGNGNAEKEVRRAAVRALGSFGELAASHAGVLEAYLEDDDVDLVALVCAALGAVRSTLSIGKLVEKLGAGDVEVVVGACKGLSYLAEVGDELVGLLEHQEARVRAAALTAVGRDHGVAELQLKRLVSLLADPDAQVRINAATLISALGARAAGHAAAIGDLLANEDPGVRSAAASALGGIGEPAASEIPRLEKLLSEREEDKSLHVLTIAGLQPKVAPALRKPACAAASALAVMGRAANKSAGKIAEALDSFDEELRVQCACALAGLGKVGAQYEDKVLALLEDSQPMVVAAACYSLGSLAEASNTPTPAIADEVALRTRDKHPAVRGAAVGGLGKMGEEAAARAEYVARCCSDRVGFVRSQAVTALTGCGEVGQMYASEACRLMYDPEERVRLAAIAALPKFGERGAAFVEEVAYLLEDASAQVREASVKAIGELKGLEAPDYLSAIERLADTDESEAVRAAARQAMFSMRAIEYPAEE